MTRSGIWWWSARLVLALGACTATNPAYRGRLNPEPDAAVDEADGARPGGTDGGAAPQDAGPEAPVTADLGGEAALPARDAPTVADADPRPTVGLVASWSFAGPPPSGSTITDESGASTATLHDTTWSGETAPGQPAGSQSLSFDGKTSWVDLTIANLPRSEAPKTIAIWYRSTASTPRLRSLVSLFSAAEVMYVGVQLGFNGTQLAYWRFGAADAEGAEASSLNAWHHGAYTFSGSVHRLYVDGVPSMTFTGDMKAGALDRVRLGTYDPPDELFQGQVNDLRIYDRVLDDSEIAALARRP